MKIKYIYLKKWVGNSVFGNYWRHCAPIHFPFVFMLSFKTLFCSKRWLLTVNYLHRPLHRRLVTRLLFICFLSQSSFTRHTITQSYAYPIYDSHCVVHLCWLLFLPIIVQVSILYYILKCFLIKKYLVSFFLKICLSVKSYTLISKSLKFDKFIQNFKFWV